MELPSRRAKFATRAVAIRFAEACEDLGYSVWVSPEFAGCTTVRWTPAWPPMVADANMRP